ncbi:MAG: hypothetical protein ACREJM_13750, partial [Candidatus Saccharimonadales bacterium]
AFTGVLRAAERGPPPVQERAIDVASLVGGERVFGMQAASPTGDKLSFVVQRQWLQKHQPKLYRATIASEDEQRRRAWEELRRRLTEWRGRRTEPKVFVSFLDRSLREVEAQLASRGEAAQPPEPSQLIVLELPKGKIRNCYIQPPAVRRLLQLAWQERLEDAEDLSAKEIGARLKARGIDADRAQPDLSDRFDIQPQTDRQWAAKVAVVEFEILGEPHYQGTGGVLLRDGGDQHRPKVADLVGSLLQDQLGDVLGDLVNDAGGAARPKHDRQREATDKALAAAASDVFRGVRVTYLAEALANQQVTVDDRFYARMPDDSWQAIWQKSATLDANRADKNDGARLAADPQVAEIMKVVKGLGLDANQDLFQTALRFGAVTQEAMQATDRDIVQFLQANSRRLSGPPLIVP